MYYPINIVSFPVLRLRLGLLLQTDVPCDHQNHGENSEGHDGVGDIAHQPIGGDETYYTEDPAPLQDASGSEEEHEGEEDQPYYEQDQHLGGQEEERRLSYGLADVSGDVLIHDDRHRYHEDQRHDQTCHERRCGLLDTHAAGILEDHYIALLRTSGFIPISSMSPVMKDTAFEAVTRARNQASSGNPAGAAETLEAYLAMDPHNTGPRLVLANIAIKDLEDEKYGLMQLDIILDLEPENVDAMKAKASYLAQDKRNNRETSVLFERILNVAPSADVYNEYARFLRNQMTDFRKAAENYEEAIRLDPRNYIYHQNYSILLLNDLKDYAKAKTELEILMDMKPGDVMIKRNYEKLMREKFDKDGNVKKKGLLGKLRK